MKLLSQIQAWSAPLRSHWLNLAPPVRRGLSVGGLVAAVVLFWAYVWLPVERARTDLLQRQGSWESQQTAMRALAEEAGRMRQIAPVAAKPVTRVLADQASLQALFGANTKVKSTDGRSFHLSAANVAYAGWLEKLDQALAKYRLRLGSAKLQVVKPAEERTVIDAEWVLADE